MKFEVHLSGASGETKKHVVELEREGMSYRVKLDGEPVNADAMQIAPNTISVLLNGQAFEVHLKQALNGTVKLQTGPHEFTAEVQDPRAWQGRQHGAAEIEGQQQIVAPMPGRIIAVHVAPGTQVEKGAPLIVLEAMKMEHVLKAGQAGKIEHVGSKPGDQIREGQELLRFAAPA